MKTHFSLFLIILALINFQSATTLAQNPPPAASIKDPALGLSHCEMKVVEMSSTGKADAKKEIGKITIVGEAGDVVTIKMTCPAETVYSSSLQSASISDQSEGVSWTITVGNNNQANNTIHIRGHGSWGDNDVTVITVAKSLPSTPEENPASSQEWNIRDTIVIAIIVIFFLGFVFISMWWGLFWT